MSILEKITTYIVYQRTKRATKRKACHTMERNIAVVATPAHFEREEKQA